MAVQGGRPPSGRRTGGRSGGAGLERIQTRVGEELERFLRRQRPVVLAAGEELQPQLAAIDELLATGKRLRPAFCYWGWRGAGGPDCQEIIAAAASLELLHAGALVHDDVMDASDTRRGRPSVHQCFAARHAAAGWHGSARSFGVGAAILVGDLLFSWADQMFRDSGLPPAAVLRAHQVLAVMRTELMAGQYLDLFEQAGGPGSVESALRVATYKTAKYTVERPLHLGATLAGAGEDVAGALTRFGLPLGTAFQLRDDVLGVFGDPAQTGKPAGDDLREGKRTVLIAIAFARADPAQAATLERMLGDPGLGQAGVGEVRSVISACGALDACEALIERHRSEALAALADAPLTEDAKAALTELAVASTCRAG